MTAKLADDASAIKKRMEEIQLERMQAIMGRPIESVEAPKDIDWVGYDYAMGRDYDPA